MIIQIALGIVLAGLILKNFELLFILGLILGVITLFGGSVFYVFTLDKDILISVGCFLFTVVAFGALASGASAAYHEEQRRREERENTHTVNNS